MAFIPVFRLVGRLLTAATIVIAIVAANAPICTLQFAFAGDPPAPVQETDAAHPSPITAADHAHRTSKANATTDDEAASSPTAGAAIESERAHILGLLIFGHATNRPFGSFK